MAAAIVCPVLERKRNFRIEQTPDMGCIRQSRFFGPLTWKICICQKVKYFGLSFRLLIELIERLIKCRRSMHIGTQGKSFVFFLIVMQGKCLMLTLESEIIVEF